MAFGRTRGEQVSLELGREPRRIGAFIAHRSPIRLAAVAAASAAALVAAGTTGADPGGDWTVPASPLVVEATSAAGAVVTFSVDAPAGVPTCVPASGSTFPLGDTTVTCSVDAPPGVGAAPPFTVSVRDTTAPVINVPSDMTVSATSPAGAVVTYTATAADAVDPAPAVTCTPASGSTFALGKTTVTCTAQDASGNTSSASFAVTVADRTPPVLSVPAPITTAATGPTGATVAFTVTATDDVDPKPTVSCTPASGSVFALATTTVSCTATDASGNQSTASFTVSVDDTAPPTLTVPAEVIAEATSAAGASVSFTATAVDSIDPSPAVSCTPPAGSTFPLGTTTVTCTARDASGNQSTPGTFVVTVRDTTGPAITVPADMTATATGPAGAQVAYTATATDSVDPRPTLTCAPAAGPFPIGTTTVTCRAQDAAGNRSSATFTVTITASGAPTFSGVPASLVYDATGPDGARASYTPPTAKDAAGAPVPVSCAPAPGAAFPLGSTIVTCTATDSRGSTATAAFPIKVVDATPPVLTVPAPVTVTTTGASVAASAVASFLGGAVARDIVDRSPTITTDAPAAFPLGTTTVTFTARDAAGNRTSATSTLTVVAATTAAGVATPAPTPAVVDRTPPDDVSGLKAVGTGTRVVLTWTPPTAPDFDHVVIVRGDPSGTTRATVYSGNATTFVDAVSAGTEYRYVITTYDHAGNASAGIALLVKPSPAMLTTPLAGAKLKHPPLLAWLPAVGTAYYNVQLYRGKTKILSLWPAGPRVQLPARWRFRGHRYTLTAGVYTWYVWPGIGARSANRYGRVLGQSTFSIR